MIRLETVLGRIFRAISEAHDLLNYRPDNLDSMMEQLSDEFLSSFNFDPVRVNQKVASGAVFLC